MTASSNLSYTTFQVVNRMEEIKTAGPLNKAENPVVNGKPIVRPLSNDGNTTNMKWTGKTIIILVTIIIFGVGTGYGVYALKTAGTVRLAGKDIEVIKTATEEGVKDASTFKDTATGILHENDGKITDEGTHILSRGDDSQNAYLTSSVVDMSKYVGKKVQVWGETFQGNKAGWLMDVGRIKAL